MDQRDATEAVAAECRDSNITLQQWMEERKARKVDREWYGELEAITAVMRGGPPRTETFQARVVLIGEGVHVEKYTYTGWVRIDERALHVPSLLHALVKRPFATRAPREVQPLREGHTLDGEPNGRFA